MIEAGKWSPYLEKMKEQMKHLTLNEINQWNGQDLTQVRALNLSHLKGGLFAYHTQKIEKIGMGNLYLSHEVHYGFLTLIPDDNYALPIFISLWEEREKEISFLVDFMPTVDSLIDEEYRKRYLESVQPLWEKYASLPGICPEESDTIRSLCSIIYTAARIPIENEGLRAAALAPHLEYLKNYLAFLPEATVIEDEGKRKEVQRKKAAVRKTLTTSFSKDIVKAPLTNERGDTLSPLIATLLF